MRGNKPYLLVPQLVRLLALDPRSPFLSLAPRPGLSNQPQQSQRPLPSLLPVLHLPRPLQICPRVHPLPQCRIGRALSCFRRALMTPFPSLVRRHLAPFFHLDAVLEMGESPKNLAILFKIPSYRHSADVSLNQVSRGMSSFSSSRVRPR